MQNCTKVFDKKTGRSIGFASCVGKAEADSVIKLPAHDAGRLRAIDPMRDDEQHWFNDVSEQCQLRWMPSRPSGSSRPIAYVTEVP